MDILIVHEMDRDGHNEGIQMGGLVTVERKEWT